jgi:hypothetical protein
MYIGGKSYDLVLACCLATFFTCVITTKTKERFLQFMNHLKYLNLLILRQPEYCL